MIVSFPILRLKQYMPPNFIGKPGTIAHLTTSRSWGSKVMNISLI